MPRGDRPPEPLSVAEVRSLLAACGGGSLSAVRNHALLVLLWRCGLRCAEALALRESDIDFAAHTVRVLHGKGRRARTVGIDDAALAAVGVWAGARSAAGIDGGPLFCRLHGQLGAPLSPRYVRAEIKRLAGRAGIRHRVHCHGLRHTMAVELRREGWPIPEISRQLGHSSIATTQIYVDHLFPAEVIDRARARSWGLGSLSVCLLAAGV
jgi:integrase/recombinase XerD